MTIFGTLILLFICFSIGYTIIKIIKLIFRKRKAKQYVADNIRLVSDSVKFIKPTHDEFFKYSSEQASKMSEQFFQNSAKSVLDVFDQLNEKVKKEAEERAKENPYIKRHKQRMQNDEWYDEYLKWANENNAEIPSDKVKFPEEKNFDEEMKKAGYKTKR